MSSSAGRKGGFRFFAASSAELLPLPAPLPEADAVDPPEKPEPEPETTPDGVAKAEPELRPLTADMVAKAEPDPRPLKADMVNRRCRVMRVPFGVADSNELRFER